MHNVEDVLAPLDQGTILRRATMEGSLTIEILLSLTTSETEVRNLPIAYRKCRYKDENNLKYFKVWKGRLNSLNQDILEIHLQIYRPGLCRMECRITAALQKCGCKPFFYAVAPHVPTCDLTGMLCLSKENWPQVARCKCLSLCEEAQYIGMQTTLQKDVGNLMSSNDLDKWPIHPRRWITSSKLFSLSFSSRIQRNLNGL